MCAALRPVVSLPFCARARCVSDTPPVDRDACRDADNDVVGCYGLGGEDDAANQRHSRGQTTARLVVDMKIDALSSTEVPPLCLQPEGNSVLKPRI